MAGKYSKAIMPEDVNAKLEMGEKLSILDVREIDEWESGHIPDAKHIPLGYLTQRHTELDKNKEMIVVCHSGNRSSVACEFLEEMGYNVVNMTGGMSHWTGPRE
ncbi:rhodanese-like domain-containing protein [Paenibacillus sp. D2_2]|uniref:rhodanese-like domain-containing protein n=1 Tax=Paenibacillus sp. D2_2 TaxID=3073092 RepID=UPI00281659C6|nr:rhodanese-like domain-containing protein [Paenibacillus sp. D2_2]WMT41240.1 rhodanese-like domain-containing protein [Paenibacillus sp. D2_2]